MNYNIFKLLKVPVITVFLTSFLVYIISHSFNFDFSEVVLQHFMLYEGLELDELFLIASISAFILFIYYYKLSFYDKKILVTVQTDSLTNLPNRVAFSHEYHTSQKDTASLIIINVNNFKYINYHLGFFKGDDMIQSISQRLNELVMSHFKAPLYRLYGDEFGFFSSDSEKDIKKKLEIMKSKFESKYFTIDEAEIFVQLHISLSNTKPKLQTAMYALQKAKENFDGDIILYHENDNFEPMVKENTSILSLLKNAHNNNLFVPYFQPIVDNKTGETLKYEALVRIKTSEAIVSPFVFLELSKKFRLYHYISQIMIQKSFEIFINMPEELSINLSYLDVNNKTTMDIFYKNIKKYPSVARRLTVEIVETEETLLDDSFLKFRKQLHIHNIKLAIDDFGTGYSNWSNILKLEPDFIKLDGSLIKDIQTNKANYSVVESVVLFAKNNNIKTVAEYVETEEIYNILKEMKVDFSQGFYFSRPIELSAS